MDRLDKPTDRVVQNAEIAKTEPAAISTIDFFCKRHCDKWLSAGGSV